MKFHVPSVTESSWGLDTLGRLMGRAGDDPGTKDIERDKAAADEHVEEEVRRRLGKTSGTTGIAYIHVAIGQGRLDLARQCAAMTGTTCRFVFSPSFSGQARLVRP